MAGKVIAVESFRGDENQFVFHERLGAHAAVPGGAFDEADIDFALLKELDDFGSVAAVQGKLHAGMLTEEGAEEAREDVLRDGGGDAEGEFTGKVAVAGTEGAFGVGDKVGDFLRVGEE